MSDTEGRRRREYGERFEIGPPGTEYHQVHYRPCHLALSALVLCSAHREHNVVRTVTEWPDGRMVTTAWEPFDVPEGRLYMRLQELVAERRIVAEAATQGGWAVYGEWNWGHDYLSDPGAHKGSRRTSVITQRDADARTVSRRLLLANGGVSLQQDEANVRHVVTNQPMASLAECAEDARILKHHAPDDDHTCSTCNTTTWCDWILSLGRRYNLLGDEDA